MSEETLGKFQKICTLIGGFLLIMPTGLFWIWGNMAVYVLSYVAMKLKTTSGLSAPWVISLFTIFWIVSLILSNLLCKYISRRWSIFLGFVITDFASYLSYLAIQKSLMVFNLSFGALLGFGTGLIYGNIVQIIIGCAGQHVGLFSSLVQGFFSFGALITVQVVTLFVNQENHSPSWKFKKELYFTQTDVIDKVPSMFLVFGACSLTMHLVGFGLLQFNPSIGSKYVGLSDKTTKDSPLSSSKDSVINNTDMPNKNTISSDSESPNRKPTTISSDSELTNKKPAIISSDSELSNQKPATISSDSELTNQKPATVSSDNECPYQNSAASYKHVEIEYEDHLNYTPWQMLKTARFYCLWLLFFMGDMPYILLTNYYKLYGQLWIHDDHFLANVGTTMIFTNFIFRLIWGLAIDRFGVKNCFVTLISLIAVNALWFCLTAIVSRWVFFFATLVYGLASSAQYSCFMSAIAVMFGKKHISTNYGLLLTSSVAFNSMAPIIIEVFLGQIGWFFTFAGTGALNVMSLILCVTSLPKI